MVNHHVKFDFTVRLHDDEGESVMAKVSGSYQVTVQPPVVPPPPALVLTPANGNLPDETEGVPVAGDKVTTVSGGVPPYTYSNVQGVPDGMALSNGVNPDGSESITLSGTPVSGSAAKSPFTLSFDVTDSGG